MYSRVATKEINQSSDSIWISGANDHGAGSFYNEDRYFQPYSDLQPSPGASEVWRGATEDNLLRACIEISC